MGKVGQKPSKVHKQINRITFSTSSVKALWTIFEITGPGQTVLMCMFGKSVSSVRRELKKPCGQNKSGSVTIVPV